MQSRFLQALRPFIAITPNIGKPTREVSFNEKVFWTVGAVVVYFLMASIPIIGADIGEGDPFGFIRVITASTYGSLAEIGVGAIVTSGLIMQVLVGLKIIKVNLEDSEEQSLYNGAQKVISVVLTIIASIACLIGGIYGTGLDFGSQLAIMAQLFFAGIIIIYLDEIIQKGWGFGSGILLFIAGGVGLQIFQGLFAAQAIAEGTRDSPLISMRGIVLAFFAWTAQRGPIEAIGALFLRYNPANNVNLPSLSILSVLATIVVSFIIIFLESLHIKIPIIDIQPKEIQLKYPIRFLYSPIIPLILASAVLTNFHFIAKMVWNFTGRETTNNLLTLFLGTFRIDNVSNQYVPTGGLVYFLTPPRSLIGNLGVFDISRGLDTMMPSLIRALIYVAILIVLSVIFSIISLETTGIHAHEITKQHLESEIHKLGLEQNEKMIETSLEMNIRKITIIGGVVTGSLAALADFFGVLGTGIGILLLISIIRLIKKEEDSETKIGNIIVLILSIPIILSILSSILFGRVI
ncbi:MAG: hypothetical protein ACXADY_07760 [Candidatus Hodarchaeales archaeon]|jgi:preprotein translocase subunit SecY